MEAIQLEAHNKDLIIVGAGGLGRILCDSFTQQGITISGFLDTRVEIIGKDYSGHKVLGSPLNFFNSNFQYISAVGDPRLKYQLLNYLEKCQAHFYSSHYNTIGENITLDYGCFVTPGASISHNVTIGKHVYIDTSVIVGHDVLIDDYCTIGAMVFIAGGVKIGPQVAIHPKATIAKGVKIGARAVIGIGSVVLWDVPEGKTVFGNPARVVAG